MSNPLVSTAGITLKAHGGGVWGSAQGMTASIVASRTAGVSPMTVNFSAADTTDSARDSHEVLREDGYYFDFDDPTSGTYTVGSNVGSSRNISIGGPITSHTFVVADGGGSVDFDVLVRVKNPEGIESIASVTVTCQAQDDYYSAANTIAVSNTLSLAADWTLYDTGAPLGATKQSVLPAWDEFNGKRIMLFRGDDFSGDTLSDLLVQVGQSNCVITFFGDAASASPIVDLVKFNCHDAAGSQQVSDTDLTTYGGWSDSLTTDDIEASQIDNGHSFTHIGHYKTNLDSSAKASGGRVYLSNGGVFAYSNPGTLSPSNTPFPVGAYLDRATIVGSPTVLPLVNIGGFNAPYLIRSSVSECSARQAKEHNMRIMSWQNFAIHDCDFLGEHIGGVGNKHRLTIRADGYNSTHGDLTGKNYGIADNTYPTLPQSNLACIQNIHSDAGAVGQAASGFKFGPSNGSALALIDDIICRSCEFVDNVQTGTINVLLEGRYITSTEQTYSTGGRSNDDGQGGNYDLNAIIPLTPNYIDQTPIPVPTAPR